LDVFALVPPFAVAGPPLVRRLWYILSGRPSPARHYESETAFLWAVFGRVFFPVNDISLVPLLFFVVIYFIFSVTPSRQPPFHRAAHHSLVIFLPLLLSCFVRPPHHRLHYPPFPSSCSVVTEPYSSALL